MALYIKADNKKKRPMAVEEKEGIESKISFLGTHPESGKSEPIPHGSTVEARKY